MGFTEKLDLLMKEKKINKAELSRESGIPYTTIDGFYKKGSENIKLTTLKKLSNYFGCTLDYLVLDEVIEPNKHFPPDKWYLEPNNNTKDTNINNIYIDNDTEISILTHPDMDKLPDEVKADILKQALEEKQKMILDETEQILNIKKELDNIEKKD